MIGKKKPPMNLSDHIRLSVRLELARLTLMNSRTDIMQHHLRKNSCEMRKIDSAIRKIEELESLMDDIVCNDEPDGVGDACVKVYYNLDNYVLYDRDELPDVLDNYAVRNAERLLMDDGIKMDAEEIVLTRFDSISAQYCNEERDSDQYLHIKSGTGYVTAGSDGTVSRRPPEDEINPNQTKYVLCPCQIRDFCEDAMKSGKYPSDEDIAHVLWRYRIDPDEEGM